VIYDIKDNYTFYIAFMSCIACVILFMTHVSWLNTQKLLCELFPYITIVSTLSARDSFSSGQEISYFHRIWRLHIRWTKYRNCRVVLCCWIQTGLSYPVYIICLFFVILAPEGSISVTRAHFLKWRLFQHDTSYILLKLLSSVVSESLYHQLALGIPTLLTSAASNFKSYFSARSLSL